MQLPPMVFERTVLLQLLKKNLKNHIKPFQEGKQLILHISLPNVSPLTIHTVKLHQTSAHKHMKCSCLPLLVNNVYVCLRKNIRDHV